MQRSVKGEVVSSTLMSQQCVTFKSLKWLLKRLKAEHKKDVVILLDSITRLGRAYNAVVPSSGKVLTEVWMLTRCKDLKDFLVLHEI